MLVVVRKFIKQRYLGFSVAFVRNLLYTSKRLKKRAIHLKKDKRYKLI